MPEVWFTSDLHLGHTTVATIRGFSSVREHDETICDRWADAVRWRDQVWVLGDLTVGNPRYALERLAALPGEKHMVWGNHDQGHPMHRNAHRKARLYVTGLGSSPFASAQSAARRRVGGREVLLSHFPYTGDTDGRRSDRYGQWRLRNEGVPLLHGHTHSAKRRTSATYTLRREREGGGVDTVTTFTPQFHVGVDACGWAPVSLAEVESWMVHLPPPSWSLPRVAARLLGEPE